MKCFTSIAIFLGAGLIYSAKPKYHTLVITTKDGKMPEYVGDFIGRRFPELNWKKYSALAYYKARPELPVAACAEAEYYLLGPGEELLQKGCLQFNNPTAAAWQIERALKEYYANLGRRL